MPRPPRSTLFPYTTLFRSSSARSVTYSDVWVDFSIDPIMGAVYNAPKIGTGRIRRCVVEKRSEEHTSELQSRRDLVCRLLLEKKKDNKTTKINSNLAM